MMLGGYIWGCLGDVFGRRRVLIVSLLVNATAGLLSSLMQNFPAFLIMRFISGLGLVEVALFLVFLCQCLHSYSSSNYSDTR